MIVYFCNVKTNNSVYQFYRQLNPIMKHKNIPRAYDETCHNSKEFSKLSSRQLGCYDPKTSTFLTSKNMRHTKSQHAKRNNRIYKKPNWNFSATTLTRDDSPSHAIPQSQRFSSLEQDVKKNGKFLTLDLRKQLTKGISFTRSKRKDYFIKRQNANYPSSATYHKNPQDFQFKGHNNIKIANLLMDYEDQQRIHYINHTINNNRRKKIFEGVTIPKFDKDHARFLYHGRQIPHTPEIFRNNPGVGAYNLHEQKYSKLRNPSYSMRLVLQRFNQNDEIIPGTGAYNLDEPRPHSVSSINQKGTFQQSRRIFLQSPDNKVPGPGAYQKK